MGREYSAFARCWSNASLALCSSASAFLPGLGSSSVKSPLGRYHELCGNEDGFLHVLTLRTAVQKPVSTSPESSSCAFA